MILICRTGECPFRHYPTRRSRGADAELAGCARRRACPQSLAGSCRAVLPGPAVYARTSTTTRSISHRAPASDPSPKTGRHTRSYAAGRSSPPFTRGSSPPLTPAATCRDWLHATHAGDAPDRCGGRHDCRHQTQDYVPFVFYRFYHTRMPVQPTFLLDLRFCDLAEWWLRLECCGRRVDLPFRLLAGQKTSGRLGSLLRALRCRDCGRRPGRVVLVADPADRVAARGGAAGGWQIEIVLPDAGGSLSAPAR